MDGYGGYNVKVSKLKNRIYRTDQVRLAAQDIKAGKLVAFPTETVYGLGADATNKRAVKKVFAAKHRPQGNPLNITVDGVGMVRKYARTVPVKAQKLMKRFWPGPLTIILNLKPGTLSSVITGGMSTIAFRDQSNPVTIQLIKDAGVPIVGPSANISGKPSPTLPQHVLHDLNGRIAGIIDAGPSKLGIESTVLDMSRSSPLVLRPGDVSIQSLEKVIGKVKDITKLHPSVQVDKRMPGVALRHYSTRAPVLIVDHKSEWQDVASWANYQEFRVGVMATDDVLAKVRFPHNVNPYHLGTSLKAAGRRFFGGLRYFDDVPAIKYIMVQAFPDDDTNLGEAYMNRLDKSANKMHFEKDLLKR